jgi:hypothetical protein
MLADVLTHFLWSNMLKQDFELQNRFRMLALEEHDSTTNTPYTMLPLERSDVWDVRWATDDALVLAVMEKTKLYIVRDLDVEAPIVTSHYPVSFANLEATMVNLDAIMKKPEVRSRHVLLQTTAWQYP